jgi:hypothetical protein
VTKLKGYHHLNIDVSLLSEHDGVLQVEVKQDDHLAVARLVEGVLDVVVQDVNLKRRFSLV